MESKEEKIEKKIEVMFFGVKYNRIKRKKSMVSMLSVLTRELL